MRLYDNEAYREQFTELVYDLLASDPDNDRANQIISAFDDAPLVEAFSVEVPFNELGTMDWRSIYMVCRDDPSQNGWATLRLDRILDHVLYRLKFLDRSKREILLTEDNFHQPWVPCYREPTRAQSYVFVSGDRYRRLKADYDALKEELDTLKTEYRERAETA